jgi:hypothetical protein
MKRFTSFCVVLGLATAGTSAALAEEKDQQVLKQESKPQPVQMTEAQMDNVAAGALLNVFIVDVADVNNVANNLDVNVLIPVNASVAAGILGNAGSLALQRPGRILN